MVNLKHVFSSTLAVCLALSSCKSMVTETEESPSAPVIAVAVPLEVKGVKSKDPNSSPVFDLSLSSKQVPDGTLLLLRIHPLIETDTGKMKVRFEGEEFPTFNYSDGNIGALVAVPFNSKPRVTRVDFFWVEGTRTQSTSIPLEVVDGNYKSETLKVDEKKVTPPKKVMKRIMREQKEIGAIYRTITAEKIWSGTFSYPLDTELTSPFGTKRVYNGHMNGFHQGLDFRARTPIPIKAPENARVALAKDLYFTGNTVILDHGYGLYTIYGHMSRLDVKAGDRITKAQILGLSGASGRATGPHLHWGAVLMRQKFNPLDLKRVLR